MLTRLAGVLSLAWVAACSSTGATIWLDEAGIDAEAESVETDDAAAVEADAPSETAQDVTPDADDALDTSPDATADSSVDALADVMADTSSEEAAAPAPCECVHASYLWTTHYPQPGADAATEHYTAGCPDGAEIDWSHEPLCKCGALSQDLFCDSTTAHAQTTADPQWLCGAWPTGCQGDCQAQVRCDGMWCPDTEQPCQ